MREKWIPEITRLGGKLPAATLIIISTVAAIFAQSSADASDVRARLARARALAAAHNLAAAANELDAIRRTSSDDSVRDVARLMLMGICLEEGNYMRAQMLLDELFASRSERKESTTEAYFALAGQALNGAREHLERYRSFGINVADKDLPTDAIGDLDRLRTLLEKIADQARQMSAEDAKAGASSALLEDVSSLRASLARNNQERQHWQHEMASARQKLSAEETRLTPVSATSSSQRAAASRNDGNNALRPATTNNSPAAAPNSSPTTNASTPAEKRSVPAPQPTTADNTEKSQSARPQDGNPLNVGSLIEKATQKINPSYPQTAKSARITGIVTVYLEIDQTGAVSTVQSTSGPALLRPAAVEAARRWRFRPTLVDGQPVRVVGFINFNFTL